MKFKNLEIEDKEAINQAFDQENWQALQKLFNEILETMEHDIATTSIEDGFERLQRAKVKYDGVREFIAQLNRARTALRNL